LIVGIVMDRIVEYIKKRFTAIKQNILIKKGDTVTVEGQSNEV